METALCLGLILSISLLTACNACSTLPDQKSSDQPTGSVSAFSTQVTTSSQTEATSPEAAPVAQGFPPVELASGLQFTDIRIGVGAEAVDNKKITVHYVGTLVDGTKFDSSRDRNQPFSFNLGAGEVIAGWEQGVKGMREGGARKLVIPPSLGYANESRGVIPSNSTLLFEIELLKVEETR